VLKAAIRERRPSLADQVRHSVSLVLGDYPRLYYPVMRRRERYKELLISDETEIVVEGYPRSGNTFAVAALQFAQERRLHIARHTHSPAQVMEAVRRRLPTLVLVREPRDAGISLVIREPAVSLERALKRYRKYHRRIYARRAGFVVATFSEVTSDFGPVVVRLNQRFGLALSPFDHTPGNCEAVFTIVEDMERKAFAGILREHRVARPSDARSEPKARLTEAIEQAAYRSILEDCDGLYREFETLAHRKSNPIGTDGLGG
jgi:hypothetical protein